MLLPAMLNEHHACARCGRDTPVDDLVLWTSRERLREYSRRGARGGAAPSAQARVLQGAGGVIQAGQAAPAVEETAPLIAAAAQRQGAAHAAASGGRAVQYRWVTVAHAVCPPCHTVIQKDAGRFHDPDRRRALLIALAVVAMVALIWVSFTMFLPSWSAAFFRNGV